MLEGFEHLTAELSDYEKQTLLPKIVAGLSTKRGKDKAITNKRIVQAMKDRGFEITEVRVRKLVNHIRTQGIIPGLIATSAGYYISNDAQEIETYLRSLRQRDFAFGKDR